MSPEPGATVVHERVAQARDGRNPTVIARMPSGWAVLGDQQFLPGYALLLPDPVVAHLTDLDERGRAAYLRDMARIGDALLAVTDAERINYEILGNSVPVLHAHVTPRYQWEPQAYRTGPVWSYAIGTRLAVPFSDDAHGGLRDDLGRALGA